MVGIIGMGGIPEPANSRQVRSVDSNSNVAAPAPNTPSGDRVFLSDEAKAAADLRRLSQTANAQSEVRAEAVERAKQNLEQGIHQIVEVVRVIASRVAVQIEA